MATRSGRRFTGAVDEPLGAASNPLPDAQLREKFHALADPVIGSKRAEGVARDVWALERMADVRPFIEGLAA